MEKLKYQIIPKFSALKHHQASVHSQSCRMGQARRGWCISAPQCLVSLAGGSFSTLLTVTASDWLDMGSHLGPPLACLTAWWLSPKNKVLESWEAEAVRLLRLGSGNWLWVTATSFYWSEHPQPTKIQGRREDSPPSWEVNGQEGRILKLLCLAKYCWRVNQQISEKSVERKKI